MSNRLGQTPGGKRLASGFEIEPGGLEWWSHRRSTRGYAWGAMPHFEHQDSGIQQNVVLDDEGETIRAYPQVFPVAGTITALHWYLVTGMVAGQKISFAIYDSDMNLYPANRVYNSGELTNLSGVAGDPQTLAPNIHVEKNSVLWLAWNYNTAFAPASGLNSQLMVTYNAYASANMLGFESGVTVAQLVSENRSGHGWKKAAAYDSGMPNPFPSSATVIDKITSSDITNEHVPLVLMFFTRDS